MKKKKYNDSLVRFLEFVRLISNKEYQKRNWLSQKDGYNTEFDEIVCNFELDKEVILANLRDFRLSQSQKSLLQDFIFKFDEFCDIFDEPDEFIDTFQWKQIRVLALKVLNEFNFP